MHPADQYPDNEEDLASAPGQPPAMPTPEQYQQQQFIIGTVFENGGAESARAELL